MTHPLHLRRADGPLRPSTSRRSGSPLVGESQRQACRLHAHATATSSPAGDLIRGRNRLDIAFTAGDAPAFSPQRRLLAIRSSGFGPDALPCFDQPDLKGRWTLTLDHPARWQSVANGAELSRQANGSRAHPAVRRRRRRRPSYPRRVRRRRVQGRDRRCGGRMRSAPFHPRNRLAGRWRATARRYLFHLHAAAVAYLERYTAIPAAFGKFDLGLYPRVSIRRSQDPANPLQRADAYEKLHTTRTSRIAAKTPC